MTLAAFALCTGCRSGDDPARPSSADLTAEEAPGSPTPSDSELAEARRAMVAHLRAEGIEDRRVLEAIASVPRHELVAPELRDAAYLDRPLPIGEGQTISQPFIVALMTALADVQPGDRVLEVGTGSGYQAAVLAELTDALYTIEIVRPLAERARRDLERLGYGDAITFRVGDGHAGWPDAAPFDAIVVTAAPPKVPEPLKEQLAMGGRMVIPVGTGTAQELHLLEKTPEGLVERKVVPVLFVPMTGEAQTEE